MEGEEVREKGVDQGGYFRLGDDLEWNAEWNAVGGI